MANETLIKKILSISPFVEVMVRVFYYKNIKFLKKYSYLYRVHPYNKNKSIKKKFKKKGWS